MMRVRAFAKINLSLRVLGVLADGYHELRTIFQSISLHDTLSIRRVRGPFWLVCDEVACPADSTNLVWRAAEAVWTASGRPGSPRNVGVTLAKKIPMTAGLGGGSSDAAAALRAFARLWRVDARRLPNIAASLGADVPYFLEGGTVLGLERGDVLFPLIDQPRAWVTLVVPSFGISTTEAYAWFDQEVAADRQDRVWADLRVRPGADTRVGPYGECRNDLEPAVAKRHPEITRMVSALRDAGASYAAMTGSGSSVFGLFDRKAAADRAAKALADSERGLLSVIVTRTLTRAECRRLAAK
jgi:4-diphosphocytidyl-2-C-methyl-D-erythritol kinase